MAERSSARVCGRLLAGIVGSDPAGGEWVCVSCECFACCQLQVSATTFHHVQRLCCVTVCDLGTSRMRRPWPTLGCCARERNILCRPHQTLWECAEFLSIVDGHSIPYHKRRMGTLFTLACIRKSSAVRGVLHPCVISHNLQQKGLLNCTETQHGKKIRLGWNDRANSIRTLLRLYDIKC